MTDLKKRLPSINWEREFETVALRRREAAENFAAGAPGAAAACGDLADRLREAGRVSDAEALYREALGLWRKLALRHPETWLPLLAESCGDLADLLSETGQASEALALSREALGLWWELEASDAAWRPDLAESCGAMAGLLADAGETREAEELYREALRLWREVSRKESGWEMDLADACRALADLLSAPGGAAYGGGPYDSAAYGGAAADSLAVPVGVPTPARAKEAERLYCEALDLYRALSKRHPRCGADAVLVCNNLGTLLCGQGRREAGEWFYRQALDLHRRQPDRTDSAPFAASACGNLAGSLEERNPAEAERLYRSALDAWRKLGKKRETADACFRLASFLFMVRGDGDGAERLMREAETLLRGDVRHMEAASHIRRVMAEWGLADPIIELPAMLPAAETVVMIETAEAALPAAVKQLPEAAKQPQLPEAAAQLPEAAQRDETAPGKPDKSRRIKKKPSGKGRHHIGRRGRDEEEPPRRWARPRR